MKKKIDLSRIDKKIRLIRKAAEELKGLGDSFPAVVKNADRILASIKMLELNVGDICRLG